MNPLIKIIFRVDASLDIGTGHVMRCLTLAQELEDRGSKCIFITKNHQGNLVRFIQEAGFACEVLPCSDNRDTYLTHSSWLGSTQNEDAVLTQKIAQNFQPDLLVVDHYALDETWEKQLQPFCKKILVIDDLADRKHSCDFLLDQNFGRAEADYQGLVSDKTKVLTGSKYALLRSEFQQFREQSLIYRDANYLNKTEVKKIFINLGGVDKDNLTSQVLQSIPPYPKFEITLVLGATSPHLATLQELAKKSSHKVKVLQGVSNIAELMAKQDLAIGAAGSTTWERACLGLPSILLVIAENQRPAALALAEAGAVKLANKPQEIAEMLANADNWLSGVSEISRELTQGLGAKLVADICCK